MLNYDNDLEENGESADEASYYLSCSGDDGSMFCCSLTLGWGRLFHLVKTADPKSGGFFLFLNFFFSLWADATIYFLAGAFMMGCKYLGEERVTSFPPDFPLTYKHAQTQMQLLLCRALL